jgi:hypothetical protein
MNRILSLIEKAEVNYSLHQRRSFAKCDKISAQMCEESNAMQSEMDSMVQGSAEWKLLLKVRLAAWDEYHAKIAIEKKKLSQHYLKYTTDVRGLHELMLARVQAQRP